MRERHPETFSEHQLQALIDARQRPVDQDAESTCPLCTETSMKQFCRHVTRHLEQLALFALPRSNEEDEDVFCSDKAHASNVSRGLSGSSLSFTSASHSVDSVFDNSIYTPGAVSELLTDFTDSQAQKLPPDFIQRFEEYMKTYTTSDESISLGPVGVLIFNDVLEAISKQGFQDLMSSQRNTKDMILVFYLNATKSFQKYVGLKK
jgi:hypothetical protein